MIPLVPLTKLPTHEEEFFAGLGVHITQEQSEVGEFLQVRPGHLAEQRSLAVDNLIMREGHNKIFAEGIQETKRQRIVMEPAIEGIFRHVVQDVMHPAHIPLQSKSEATHRSWP